MTLPWLPDTQILVAFGIVSFFIAATPGPTWIYVIGCTLSSGRLGGLFAVLGNAVGVIFHITVSTIGLSLLLASSDIFTLLLGLLGGVYLCYLGISRFWVAPIDLVKSTKPSKTKGLKIITAGALINILNPKAVVLFLALLPQFTNAGRAFAPQAFTLGLLHIVIASGVLSTMTMLVAMAGKQWLANNQHVWQWVNRVGGVIIVLFGINLLWSTSYLIPL